MSTCEKMPLGQTAQVVKGMHFGLQQIWVQVLSLPLGSRVTLGKSPHHVMKSALKGTGISTGRPGRSCSHGAVEMKWNDKVHTKYLPHTACWHPVSSQNGARDCWTFLSKATSSVVMKVLSLAPHFSNRKQFYFVSTSSRKGARYSLALCDLKSKWNPGVKNVGLQKCVTVAWPWLALCFSSGYHSQMSLSTPPPPQ